MRIAILASIVFIFTWQLVPETRLVWSADDKKSIKAIVKPLLGTDAAVHSIHSYNLTCPESPDGKWVLLFRSQTEDAHRGDVCIVARESGKLRVLASDVEVQDAHRVACQQWARGGQTVIYQDLRDGKSVVIAVDIDSLKTTVLGHERQIAFGPANADTVAIYGQHWAPAEYRDLSLVEVATGKSKPLVSADSVKPAYAKTSYASYLNGRFGGKHTTLFFPNISPDQRRLFFKLSSPNGGGYRDRAGGSDRAGIFCFDMTEQEYLFLHSKWGHPAWHPDSKHIVNMWSDGAVLINVETGKVEKKLAQPDYLRAGGHPSVAPDGRLFVTDGVMLTPESNRRRWGVVVGDFEKQQWHLIHEFDNSHGAKSWRPSHPHPVFSRDGGRIYFNVSSDRWSRLYVAELSSGETNRQPEQERNAQEASDEQLSVVSILHDDGAFNRAHDIELHGDLAFVAGKGGSLAIVDISQPDEPHLIWHQRDTKRLHDAETVLLDKERLFLGTDDFISIDLTNPRKPIFDDWLSDPPKISRINGMVRHDDTIFAASKNGWIDAFDVSTAAKPKLVTALNAREKFDIGWPHDIDLHGEYVVVPDPRRFGRLKESGKLVVLKVYDDDGKLLPSNQWTMVGFVATPELVGANRVQVTGNYAYVGASTTGQGGRLIVVDLSKPNAPQQIAVIPFADPTGFGPNGLTVAGKVVFLAGGQTIQTVDVSKPQSPQTVARWTSQELFPTSRDNGHDLVFQDGLLYVTAQNDNQVGIIRVNDDRIKRLATAD